VKFHYFIVVFNLRKLERWSQCTTDNRTAGAYTTLCSVVH